MFSINSISREPIDMRSSNWSGPQELSQKREGIVVDNDPHCFVKDKAFSEEAEINRVGGLPRPVQRDSFEHDWNKINPCRRPGPLRLMGMRVKMYGAIVAKTIAIPG